ncbi:UNVERIFIED_CONTAM: hypothetical protein FKN15_065142 [Acipenser sinensis]
MAQENLVLDTGKAPVWSVGQLPDSVASRRNSFAALGLAPERKHLSHLGLSDQVIETLQNARAASTHSQYAYKWGVFLTCCQSRGLDPTTCPMSDILQFLQGLFDEVESPATLKVYLAAFSACHIKIDLVSPGAHFLV